MGVGRINDQRVLFVLPHHATAGTWDDAENSAQQQILKSIDARHAPKQLDAYDMELDKGKVKKIRKKRLARMDVPNLFQHVQDAKLNKTSKQTLWGAGAGGDGGDGGDDGEA